MAAIMEEVKRFIHYLCLRGFFTAFDSLCRDSESLRRVCWGKPDTEVLR
jgi:hypothetical protein